MKVITNIYLVLENFDNSVKVFSQDITEDLDKRLTETRPVYSADGFKQVCYEVAEEFRVKWEDEHDLSGRTFARTRIRMD
jgi:hypothetical protein